MMKRRILLVLSALAGVAVALFAAGCADAPVIGSGDLVTETYEFKDFTRIEVSHSFEIEISRGDEFKVEVTVDDNLVDRLRVDQSGDTLRIGMEAGISFGTATRRAVVVLPTVEGLNLSGASKAALINFQGQQDLDITISGASNLAMNDIRAGDTDLNVSGASKVSGDLISADVRMEVSGASQVQFQGSGTDADLEATGASKLMLRGFPVETADVVLSGASTGTVNVSRTLDADLSGASSLTYTGGASVRNVSTSGASQINRQ